MNSPRLSQTQEQVKNNFQTKYYVDIKAMFWNGWRSYLSVLKLPLKKNVNSRIIKNIWVQKTALS